MVLRYRMMLNVSPKLICDRKVEKRIEKRCFIGSEAVDWLVKITPLVHGRFHVISMLQALLEEGIITNGMLQLVFFLMPLPSCFSFLTPAKNKLDYHTEQITTK